jgi:hypothetical protein
MKENDWRDINCPNYGHLYCDCPFEVAACNDAWTCDDAYEITINLFINLDDEMDAHINLEDNIEEEHLSILLDSCDYNNDGSVDQCEAH